MRMSDVFEVVNLLGGAESGPYGVTWGPLRVRSGSGIAGNSQTWWIDSPGHPEFATVGPIRTRRELRNALRTVVVDCLRLGLAEFEASYRLSGLALRDRDPDAPALPNEDADTD